MRAHLVIYMATFLFGAAWLQPDDVEARPKNEKLRWPYLTVSFQPPAANEAADKLEKSGTDDQKKSEADQPQKEKSEASPEEKELAREKEKSASEPESEEDTEDMAEEPAPLTEKQLADVAAMRTTAEQFAVAYAKGEAAAAAAVFTETAEYVDEQGNIYRGREEIQQLLAEYFIEHPACSLEIDIESIRFISEGVAVEDGTTIVTHGEHANAEHTQVGDSGVPHSEPADPEAPNPVAANPDAEKSPDAGNKDDEGKQKPAGDETPAPDEEEAESAMISPSELDDPQSGHSGNNPDRIESRYSAVYVSVNGKWLIASVRDFPHEGRRAHKSQLAELDWLMGDWVDEGDDALVHFSCESADNGHYLLRTFAIVMDGQEAFSGTQRIGWCPVTRKLRTWIFDSEGGYADGFWHRDGDDWALKCNGVTADGESVSYTTLYTIINEHTMTWQYVDLEIDGVLQGDSEIFSIVKRAPAPTPAVALNEK